MTDGMAVELNVNVHLNFWQVTVYILFPNDVVMKVWLMTNSKLHNIQKWMIREYQQ